MNYGLAILIYLIVFYILLMGFLKCRFNLFPALTLTAMISALLLVLMIPPSEIDKQIDRYAKDKHCKAINNWIVVFYLIVTIATLLLMAAYIIFKAYDERKLALEKVGF